MNEHSDKHIKESHGSLKSYITGFILSLVFTAIPYYMVVQKVVSGKGLLITILGFAVLQMCVQIFFFLHLGRGPKPLYNVIFFVSTVGIILVVVFGSIFIIDNLNYNMKPAEVTKKLAQKEGISQLGGEETGACKEAGVSHKVTILNGKITPQLTVAKLCDTLTFVNSDDKEREIAFGTHPRHDTYAGEEVMVKKGRPKTITLNESGSFIFHDHLDPTVSAYLSVTL